MTTTTTMTITNAPEIAGLVFRSFDPEQDFPALVDLMNVCNEADHAEEIITVESMRNFYAHAVNFNPSTDMLLAQVEGYLVGCGRVNWWVNDVGERLYGLNGCIHPEWRGKGIGRALLGWQEAHARELAATHPTTEPRFLQAFVMDTVPATVRLFERAGFTKIRYGFMMVRPNLDDVPDLPLPEGLEVRPVRPEDLRAIWEADDEAFRDHWGHRPGARVDHAQPEATAREGDDGSSAGRGCREPQQGVASVRKLRLPAGEEELYDAQGNGDWGLEIGD